MSLRLMGIIAAILSTLALLFVAFSFFKPETKPIKTALPPVEIAPPVRDITPTITQPVETAAPLPIGVELIQNNAILIANVRKTRERLLEAAQSGTISRLNTVFQMNEMPPIFTRGKEKDPVAFWKKSSGDGEGREILSALANIMSMPAVRIHKGTAQEMYVWPYLAHLPLSKLSSSQQVDLYKLLTAQDVKDMTALNKWLYWRVGIGVDGTLHYFVAGE